jgi:hypothetical protein
MSLFHSFRQKLGFAMELWMSERELSGRLKYEKTEAVLLERDSLHLQISRFGLTGSTPELWMHAAFFIEA